MKLIKIALFVLGLSACEKKEPYYLVDLFESPNKEAAFEETLSIASKGDEDASFLVAHMYANGIGVEKNIEKALEWYDKAAEKKQSCALSHLAYFAKEGIYMPLNYPKALSYVERALELNNLQAIITQGQMYFYGQGVSQDKEYALKKYQKAFMEGLGESTLSIASYYADQPSDPANQIEAYKFLEIYHLWISQNKQQPHLTFYKLESLMNRQMSEIDKEKAKEQAQDWFKEKGSSLLGPSDILKKCFDKR